MVLRCRRIRQSHILFRASHHTGRLVRTIGLAVTALASAPCRPCPPNEWVLDHACLPRYDLVLPRPDASARVFYSALLCDKIHKVRALGELFIMQQVVLPIFLFAAVATLVSLALLGVAAAVGPRKASRVKEMPYESGMDPIHDARRRFDVRFYLVAIAFLVFDVELLFLYPWAVATTNPQGIDAAVAAGWVASRQLVFGEAMSFIVLLGAGFVYAWRKGVFRWR